MSLTIELPPADETRLRERAEKAGKPVAEVAAELLRESLIVRPDSSRSWPRSPPRWRRAA